ncbi:DJ-1/PfpI/YhbO family deglycase/protease [Nocardia sp. NPDC055321]
MTGSLDGKRVLVITSNTGVEHDELAVPRDQLRAAGAAVTHAAIEHEPVRTFRHDLDPAERVHPDLAIEAVDPADYDALVIPGGTVNADKLRVHDPARALVQALVESGTPIAAICHGPWLLVDSYVLPDKTLTSYPSLRTDIVNAHGNWVDEPAVTCTNKDWPLITSRRPDDLPNFVAAITELLTRA